MSKGTNTLDELLNDPVIQLLMARDRVRPEEVRMLLDNARLTPGRMPAAHVIDRSYRRSAACA